MTTLTNIVDRLENWGRWCSTCGARAADSMTAVACRRMSDAKTGNIYNQENGIEPGANLLDDDAALLEVGMRKLSEKQRLLLKLHYVERKPQRIVCRRVHIRVGPSGFFDAARQEAEAAIEQVVDKLK